MNANDADLATIPAHLRAPHDLPRPATELAAGDELFTPFPYVGALAYLDSFSGLVPCRVDIVERDGGLTVRVTATRGAWRKGEVVRVTAAEAAAFDYVVDRKRVHVVGGQYRIRPRTAEGVAAVARTL